MARGKRAFSPSSETGSWETHPAGSGRGPSWLRSPSSVAGRLDPTVSFGSLTATRPDLLPECAACHLRSMRVWNEELAGIQLVRRDYAVARSLCKASRASNCWRMASCAALSIV